MPVVWTIAAALVGCATAAGAQATAAAAQATPPVEVMVLGTYHFASPGLDIHNPKVDDVLKPQRQRQVEAVVAGLAEFRPTKIMVERVSPNLIDPKYADFTPAMLAENRDERVQLAYRLAHRLGQRTVYAIDEQTGPGEPDYFPFGKLVEWANANGAKERLDALMAGGAAQASRIERLQSGTIPNALAEINEPAATASDQAFYYEALTFGDADQQPGAELNAYWYMRNAKIFAKLQQVAKPGDRVLVVYGSGHNYWLRHFLSTASGYRNVDPVPYLRKADAALR